MGSSPDPARSPVKEETAAVLLKSLAMLDRALMRLRLSLEQVAGDKAERRAASSAEAEPSRYGIYTATSLEQSLRRFEERFGLPSDEFYDLYEACEELPAGLGRHGANVWAGAWEEFRRLRDHELNSEDVFRTAAAL